MRHCSNAVSSLLISSNTRNGYGFKPEYIYNIKSRFLPPDRWKLVFKQYKLTNGDQFEQVVQKHVSKQYANGVENACQGVNEYHCGKMNNCVQ